MLKQLTLTEAEQLMGDGDVIIADVRDVESYEKGHIDKAIHLSMSKLQEFCESQDKSTPILLYCYHGISSQSVGQHLIEQGFTNVYSLIGGYEGWKQEHPTSDEE